MADRETKVVYKEDEAAILWRHLQYFTLINLKRPNKLIKVKTNDTNEITLYHLNRQWILCKEKLHANIVSLIKLKDPIAVM